jgi:RNA polymerase sigma-70 factor (ECF subfamily)
MCHARKTPSEADSFIFPVSFSLQLNIVCMGPSGTVQQHDSQRREQVLQLLVTHRSDIVTGILAQVRDFTVAEEVFQEVALVVAKQWQDFEPGTNFLAWARQIARNKIIAFHRERRRPEFQFSPEALASIESAGDRQSAI